MHVCARREVSLIKSVAWRTVQIKPTTTMTMLDDNIRRAINDYIGSLQMSQTEVSKFLKLVKPTHDHKSISNRYWMHLF